MKRMKRLVCMLLALCMIPGVLSCARTGGPRAGGDAESDALDRQGAGIPLSAQASAAAAQAAEDHLIVHYDFLGESLEEKLKDKAETGTSDDLTFGNAGNLSRIENGVAYINEASGNYLNVPQVSADIKNATALTFVTRFKFEGDTPGNLVDMVMLGSNLLRWSILKDGKLSATFFSGNITCALGGSTVYAPGQWIDMALTVHYDEATHTVTTHRYVSTDGWKTNIPTQSEKNNCSSNPFTGATNLTLGKNNTAIGDRGRSIAYEDFRIYNQALDISTISGIGRQMAPNASDYSHLENYLITHYDFLGEGLDEQLRDKGTAGSNAENLHKVGNAEGTYVKDGVAYVDHAQGNYFHVQNPKDIQNIGKTTDAMTVFVEFKADMVEQPANVGDALVITDTARLGYFFDTGNKDTSKRFIHTAAGKGNTGNGPNSSQDMPEGFENGWIRVAYVAKYNRESETVDMTLYYSADGGTTWNATATTTVTQSSTIDLTTMFTGNNGTNELILGKVATGIDDRGISFCYNDVRIYNKALTQAEIQSISPENYSDYRDTLAAHYDFIGNTVEEQLTDKVGDGKLTLSATKGDDGADLSYVKNGQAYIDQAKGNDLTVESLPQSVAKAKELTIFTSFCPEGAVTARQISDLLNIPNTVRLGFYDSTLRPHIRLGEGLTSENQHSGDAYTSSIVGQQVYLAAVLRLDGTDLSCILYISLDQGATWTTYAGYAVSDVSAILGNTMTLGSAGDNGLSYIFDDLRIYTTALTVDQLKTVRVYDSPDLSDVDMVPSQDLSLYFYLPEDVAEQYDSVTATAECLGESTVLEPDTVSRDGKNYLVFRYDDLSALMLEETVTLTVNATRDGKEWRGESKSYSILEYCYETIHSETASKELKQLCVDILNYGTHTQLYFGYHTEALANRDLSETELALGSTGDPKAVSTTNTAYGGSLAAESVLASFYSATVNLRNPIELLFRVKAESGDLANLTAVVTDSKGDVLTTVRLADAQSNGDGTYSFGCRAGVRITVYVTVWSHYGESNQVKVSNTLAYSAESYAASKMDSQNSELVETVKAMLRYWDSAANLNP